MDSRLLIGETKLFFYPIIAPFVRSQSPLFTRFIRRSSERIKAFSLDFGSQRQENERPLYINKTARDR